ncbi:MAG: gas vesicle protein GvpG [Pseudanabaenaceae cyanobacterium]|jgi:hypothetical protein
MWQLLTAPFDGLLWIAEQIEERALEELGSKKSLEQRLVDLQVQLDMGQITEAEYETEEAEILEALEARIAEEEEEEAD